jgi:inorganic triphosphatase YgiF
LDKGPSVRLYTQRGLIFYVLRGTEKYAIDVKKLSWNNARVGRTVMKNHSEKMGLVLALPLKEKDVLERQLSRTSVLKKYKPVYLACETHYFDSPLHPLRQRTVEIEACFAAKYDRIRWTVKAVDGSQVQVSFDFGRITAGVKTAPICELTLLLLDGVPESLWDVAHELARSIAVWPMTSSKTQRGYLLSQGNMLRPVYAKPAKLYRGMDMSELIQRVLTEMLSQFTRNLCILQRTSDPEVVHQARVGWRRFKSSIHLFEKTAYLDQMPSLDGLDCALAHLSDLRDLDVAKAYVASRVESEANPVAHDKVHCWSQLEPRLERKRQQHQAQVLAALDQPIVGATVLAICRWLELGIAIRTTPKKKPHNKAAQVLTRRISHWVDQLRTRPKRADDSATQHRTRILSKRLRYAVEALRSILPSRQVKIWYHLALRLQTEIGVNRDLFTVVGILADLIDDDGAP